jgi:hypothetical protein
MNRDVLDGTVSFNALEADSNRIIKISASIATTGRWGANLRRDLYGARLVSF